MSGKLHGKQPARQPAWPCAACLDTIQTMAKTRAP